MLFNSVEFIFLFLPVCLLIFTLLEKKFGRVPALLSIILLSAFSYITFHPAHLVILVISVLGNYFAGCIIQNSESERLRTVALTLTICANLALLYYYKYFLFTLNVLGIPPGSYGNGLAHDWVLPLGISFWTFQQINFLLERYNRRKDGLELLDYVSVVMFFPHLIAGPIVRTAELGPQIRLVGKKERDVKTDISIGAVIFIAGLAKKVLIADNISVFPDQFYQLPAGNVASVAGPVTAWFAVLTYMLQLYFDFSGYCDMGMGLARMFGFNFPINFISPLKSKSFVEFWRTWHITLTRFFTDTLHMPLAMFLMRRFSEVRPALLQSLIIIGVPVLFTFFITGFWHGAGNQFIFFGILNGVLMAGGVILSQYKKKSMWPPLGQFITFAIVSMVFIFFRTPSFSFGMEVVQSMFVWPSASELSKWLGIVSEHQFAALMVAVAMVGGLTMPNLYQLLAKYHTPLGFKVQDKGFLRDLRISLDANLGVVMVILLLASVYKIHHDGAIRFIYFQF